MIPEGHQFSVVGRCLLNLAAWLIGTFIVTTDMNGSVCPQCPDHERLLCQFSEATKLQLS